LQNFDRTGRYQQNFAQVFAEELDELMSLGCSRRHTANINVEAENRIQWRRRPIKHYFWIVTRFFLQKKKKKKKCLEINKAIAIIHQSSSPVCGLSERGDENFHAAGGLRSWTRCLQSNRRVLPL
jgi:hypothetical protein